MELKGIDYLDRTSVSLEQKKQKSAKNELLQNKEWREVSKKVTKLTKQITGLEQQISTLEQQIQASEVRLADATIYQEKNKQELESELTRKSELDHQLEASLSQWERLNREKENLQTQLVN
jgi:ATP-binding cassette subfamily F protein 3